MNIRDIPFPASGGEYHYDGATLTRAVASATAEATTNSASTTSPETPRGKKPREDARNG